MNLWMSSFVVEYIYSRSYIHNYCAGICVIQCSTAVMLLMLQITDLEIALFTLYVKLERGNAREMSIFRFLVFKFLHSSCVSFAFGPYTNAVPHLAQPRRKSLL